MPSQFMNAFDPAMPGYEALRASVTALLREAEVQSSIDLVEEEGDDRSRAVELDWLVHIVDRQDGAVAERRQERVKCRVEKSGKKWRIASLEPLQFFAPPDPVAHSRLERGVQVAARLSVRATASGLRAPARKQRLSARWGSGISPWHWAPGCPPGRSPLPGANPSYRSG